MKRREMDLTLLVVFLLEQVANYRKMNMQLANLCDSLYDRLEVAESGEYQSRAA
jgi:hypothetical protein